MSHGWFTCECGNHYHETQHPSGYCPVCAKKEEDMKTEEDYQEEEIDNGFERNYSLEIGDVVLIQNRGHGFVKQDVGKYVEITGYGDYFGEPGVTVKEYDKPIETIDYGHDGVVGYGTFGKNPMILLNTKEQVTNEVFDSSLTKRKNGKNKMELVETGFPNAFLALGEVMTWAAEYKGYEPNDWKDIPDAKNALLAAAARHRTKRLAGQEYDEESNLPHLYHEAFNVMAQLELLITGKLK